MIFDDVLGEADIKSVVEGMAGAMAVSPGTSSPSPGQASKHAFGDDLGFTMAAYFSRH